MTQDDLDNWDKFSGSNFLKVEHVKNEADAFVVLKVEKFEDDDKSPKVRLIVGKGNESYIFDLNVTNANFCKNNGLVNPKQLLEKKLYFKKVNVNSPKTHKEVESLRICKIE